MGWFSPTSRNQNRLKLAPYDVVCAIAAPFIALALRDPMLFIPVAADFPTPVVLFVLIATISAIASFLTFRLSDGMSHLFSVHDAMAIGGAIATTVAATTLVLFTFTRLDGIPRSTPIIFALVLGGLLIIGRTFHRVIPARRDKTRLAEQPDQLRNILIVGADHFAAISAKLIAHQRPRTTRVVAILDERPNMIGRTVGGVRIVGLAHDLDTVIEEYTVHGIAIDQVLISDNCWLSDPARDSLAAICLQRDIDILTISEAFGLTSKSGTSYASAPVSAPIVQIPAYFRVKRAIDVCAALGLMTLLAPLALFAAGLVLIDVGTPLLFWQERIGRNGRRFLLFKFRTYHAPYDGRGAPIAPEDRLSRFGKFLRATRFDELPQLLNILVGDMSLIGPRPLLPIDQPKDASVRLLARPGIAGWAQVNGGNHVTPEEKEALDAWYIQHASLFIDLKILIHALIIAATGERFDRQAIADAVVWRAGQDDLAGGNVEPHVQNAL